MLTEAVLLEIAKQVPLGLILMVVWLSSSRERREMARLYASATRGLSDECHRHQERGTQALIDSARALVAMASAIGGCPVRPGRPAQSDEDE